MRRQPGSTFRKTAAIATIIAAMATVQASTNEAKAQSRTALETAQRSRYADGSYTATGQYGGGPSFITVSLDLRGGMVMALEVKPHATVPRSLDLQRRFAAAVPKVVVGKPLDQIKVGKLAGSSHTPQGFNAAIRQIREQARAR